MSIYLFFSVNINSATEANPKGVGRDIQNLIYFQYQAFSQ